MPKNRYIILIDMYVHAENTKEALNEAQQIVNEINEKYDNKARIITDEIYLANDPIKPEKITNHE